MGAVTGHQPVNSCKRNEKPIEERRILTVRHAVPIENQFSYGESHSAYFSTETVHRCISYFMQTRNGNPNIYYMRTRELNNPKTDEIFFHVLPFVPDDERRVMDWERWKRYTLS